MNQSLPESPAFLQRYSSEMERLHLQVAGHYWEASLTGKKEIFEQIARDEMEILALHQNQEEFENFQKAAQQSELPSMIARQVKLALRDFRACQGDKARLERIVQEESALAQKFNTFRAEFQGEKVANNVLENRLKESRDSAEVQEAWEAGKTVGAVAAPDILELVRLRNGHAGELGFDNHHAFAYAQQELDREEIFTLFEELEKSSGAPFAAMKEELDEKRAERFGLSRETLRPWHYGDAFFQEYPSEEESRLDDCLSAQKLEPLAQRFFQEMGLPISDVLEKSDLYEKPGKDQHAFCIALNPPEDVRILANLRPTERWARTLLHELGHAAYDKELDPTLPFLLKKPAHIALTEAVALFFERFLRHPDFLTRYLGMDPKEAKNIARQARRDLSRKLLVSARWMLVMIFFERQLYARPDQDLPGLWWKLVERFQGLSAPERAAFPDWAAKMHLACAPVYYQNYLLGECMASQLGKALEGHLKGQSPIANPKTGEFFREGLFFSGNRLNWQETLAQACGERLNPHHLVQDLTQQEE